MPRKPKPPPPPEPKRHERGWHDGSVVEVRPGRFRAFRARVKNADGTSSRPSKTFSSREAAEQWARGDVQPDVLLLGHWLDRWLALRSPTIRPQTRRNYRQFVRDCAEIATVPLADLTTEVMQAHTNLLLGRWARSRVNAWRSIISSALLAAVPRYLDHNPMRGVRLPKPAEQPPKAWRAAEVARLLAKAQGRAHEVWLWVSLGTGIRQGEALALTWADVDLVNLTVTVSRARDRETRLIGPTKSGRVRVIDLPAELVPVLVAHRARQKPKEQRVCTSSYSGRVPAPTTLQTWIRQLCADAGVSSLPGHATRHTYATLALEAGVPLKEVSEALGHSSVAITAQVYAHVLHERRRRAANAIGAILAPKTATLHEIGTRQDA